MCLPAGCCSFPAWSREGRLIGRRPLRLSQTLMVHLELEHSNDARLRIAGDLGEQFDAKLIGIAACDPQPTYYADGAFAKGLDDRGRTDIKKRMAETEERFRSVMQQRARDIDSRFAMERPASSH
jgi:hypothetical protein